MNIKPGQPQEIITFERLNGILENYQQQHNDLRDNMLRMEGCKMAIEALINHFFPLLIPQEEQVPPPAHEGKQEA